MFPFQPNGELVFGAPTTSQIHDDLILDHAPMEANLISFGKREIKNDRKVMHREVEKRRRQEMSTLHASLGSLLPLTHIKGKLSISDQIAEAVNHIKQKEKKIEKLKIRRDELKKLLGPSDPKISSWSASDGFVRVNMAADGMEILISSRKERSDLGLSRLLAVLVQRQLDVVSCVSTRTEDRFLHRMKIEARNMRKLDVSELQDRLSDAIKYSIQMT